MKIINIASSDNFEDILAAVRESESTSLILIVPKSNKVFKSKNKTEQLKNHFEKLGKEVSLISTGETAVKNAKSAGFDILREAVKLSEKEDDEISSLYSEKPVGGAGEKKEVREGGIKKFVLIFLGASLLSFLFIVFTSLSQATIKIIPRKSDFSINVPVTLSDKITQTDAVYGVIPGKLIEFEKVVSRLFPSTGEKEVFQKANGRITIYNNFSTSPQTLVATTRFQTPEGLIFRIPEAVTVPGAAKTGDELKPGEIEVQVVADRAGQEYNIEPAEFKIPGFLGSPKYQGFYAKSFKKFSGGFIGPATFVTKEDLAKAEESVRQEILESIRAEIALLNNFKVLDEATDIKIERLGDSDNVGAVIEEFKITLKGKVETIAFKESDIFVFISQYVKNSQDLVVLNKGLIVDYAEPEFDKEKNELSLKLVSSGQTVKNINKEKIISSVSGRKSSEIKNYFNGLIEIESAQISLSPFWIRSAPKDKNKIKIDIVLE